MERDIRETSLYHELENQTRRLAEPAVGEILEADDPQLSSDGKTAAVSGSTLETWDGDRVSRVCLIDVSSGEISAVSSGPHDERSPRWSRDGSRLAFLSDREQKGQAQLYLADPSALESAAKATSVDGAVEYFSWSPDGSSILLGVAGKAAELSDAQGSGSHETEKPDDLPSWMPVIDTGPTEDAWRGIHLYDVAAGTARPVSRAGLNVWEAVWAGPDQMAAVVSEDPGEGAWYTSPLALIDVGTGQERILYRSDWQLGYPASSPSGARIAIIEGVASDRLVVAGDLLVIDAADGGVARVLTGGVDVNLAVWLDEDRLLFAGLRGLNSVVGEWNAATGETRELWETDESLSPRFTPAVTPASDGFLAVRESHTRYPELAHRQKAVRGRRHGGCEARAQALVRLPQLAGLAGRGVPLADDAVQAP